MLQNLDVLKATSTVSSDINFCLNGIIFAICYRNNAFEVSSMDGGASVVLYSENKGELFSWYSAIKDRVVMLLEQSVSDAY